jgi:ribulose-phosphate 3-epimerase
MVKEPINWIERCVQGQADRIIGHIEQMSDQVEFVGRVQEVGAKVGLGLDLATPVSDLDVTILNDLDTVLVMSVPAGFGGQKFDKSALEKIRELDEIRSRDKSPYVIHGDGGITFDNIGDVRRAGADEVSIGVRIFEGDLEENVKAYIKEAYKKNR